MTIRRCMAVRRSELGSRNKERTKGITTIRRLLAALSCQRGRAARRAGRKKSASQERALLRRERRALSSSRAALRRSESRVHAPGPLTTSPSSSFARRLLVEVTTQRRSLLHSHSDHDSVRTSNRNCSVFLFPRPAGPFSQARPSIQWPPNPCGNIRDWILEGWGVHLQVLFQEEANLLEPGRSNASPALTARMYGGDAGGGAFGSDSD